MLGRHRAPAAQPPESPTGKLARRFRALRELLGTNASALELITELENDLLLVPVGDAQVREHVEQLLEATGALVDALDRLAEGRYHELRTVLGAIRSEVTAELDRARRLAQGRISYPITELGRDHAPWVGSKATQLAWLRASGLPVPDGFALSTRAYHQFAREADLYGCLRAELSDVNIEDPSSLERTSQRLCAQVLATPVPPPIDLAIRAEVRRLMCPAHDTFAVRSSAVGEDSTLTFAGQFDSRIHVPQNALAEACRAVWASRFNARAIAYRVSSGVAEADCPMAVLFLHMVRARCSGVLYTRDPADARSDTLPVTASWGVGFTGASAGDRL